MRSKATLEEQTHELCVCVEFCFVSGMKRKQTKKYKRNKTKNKKQKTSRKIIPLSDDSHQNKYQHNQNITSIENSQLVCLTLYVMLHQLIERQNLDELNKILRERPLSLDLNERNAANQSPLHVAASIGDELVSCLLIDSYAVNMEIEDIWKRTPLLTAAKFEQLGVCESLLKRSANPSARDIDGNSILHLLSTAKSADAILYTRVLQTCLSSPNWSLDINSQNNDGDTPLHLAASAGNEKALLFLVNQPNVNLNAKNG